MVPVLLVAIVLQCKRPEFDPWVRKIPWRREWQPTPEFLPGEFYGYRSLADYSPWDRKRVWHAWETKHVALQTSWRQRASSLSAFIPPPSPSSWTTSCACMLHLTAFFSDLPSRLLSYHLCVECTKLYTTPFFKIYNIYISFFNSASLDMPFILSFLFFNHSLAISFLICYVQWPLNTHMIFCCVVSAGSFSWSTVSWWIWISLCVGCHVSKSFSKYSDT